MKSEIPATSGWLRVRWCVWAEHPFLLCICLLFQAVCVERGVIGAACGPLLYPEGRAGPGAVIRLREVNRGLGGQGLTQAFEMWRQSQGCSVLLQAVHVLSSSLCLLSSESVSTEVENSILQTYGL